MWQDGITPVTIRDGNEWGLETVVIVDTRHVLYLQNHHGDEFMVFHRIIGVNSPGSALPRFPTRDDPLPSFPQWDPVRIQERYRRLWE